jgi:hypothetical protein
VLAGVPPHTYEDRFYPYQLNRELYAVHTKPGVMLVRSCAKSQ